MTKINGSSHTELYSLQDAAASRTLSGRTLLILIGVAVVLRVGQEIFVPLALSLLLTFTLAPIVSFLRKRSVPKIAAVILAVSTAFLAITLFSIVVASQVTNLADNIPTYQRNIVGKVQALRQAGSTNGILDHLSKIAERVGSEMETTAAESRQNDDEPLEPSRPMQVEIVTRTNPLATLGNFILPLISPFATGGLVIVLVIFMLLEREDLRDRFIRLVGLGDLHRTTAALQDAGKRVGKYLLMQLVVNSLYAVPITVGLFILGIPNAILWGLLTLVLRFVPYIGPIIGMILPLFLALAIAPGWSLVIWVVALFLVTELISNNVFEPWLYGSHTGLSPLAIIISAIFWSWLWGPLGLMLSTPLTVCLVVLGRHVPQFSFLGVLLGNEPVLEPRDKLYQRLLAGDPNEAADNADEFLEDEDLVDYYDKVGLPALLLGEQDRQRGVMSDAQIALVASTTRTLIDNLSEAAEAEKTEAEKTEDGAPDHRPDEPLATTERSVLCLGGRGPLDDAAAAMLDQLLEAAGARVVKAETPSADGRMPLQFLTDDLDTVVVAFLNGNSKSHARRIVRRLKSSKAGLRVGIFMPMANGEDHPRIDIVDINADFLALNLREAMKSAMADAAPVALTTAPRKPSRPNALVARRA